MACVRLNNYVFLLVLPRMMFLAQHYFIGMIAVHDENLMNQPVTQDQ